MRIRIWVEIRIRNPGTETPKDAHTAPPTHCRPLWLQEIIIAPKARQKALKSERFPDESFELPVWYNNICTGHSCNKVPSLPRRDYSNLYYSIFVTLMPRKFSLEPKKEEGCGGSSVGLFYCLILFASRDRS